MSYFIIKKFYNDYIILVFDSNDPSCVLNQDKFLQFSLSATNPLSNFNLNENFIEFSQSTKISERTEFSVNFLL